MFLLFFTTSWGWPLATLALPVDLTLEQHTPKNDLIFGVLPITSTERLIERFAPLSQHLSEKLGINVRLETARDYQQFLIRTNKDQRYDILLTAPHFYYLAHHLAGYKALVRVNKPGMQMIIVVPINSTIKQVSDLAGRRVADG